MNRTPSQQLKDSFIENFHGLMNTTPTDTFYDLKMTNGERAVLLKAAHLPTAKPYLERKFSAWPVSARNSIKAAARDASRWAAGLAL